VRLDTPAGVPQHQSELVISTGYGPRALKRPYLNNRCSDRFNSWIVGFADPESPRALHFERFRTFPPLHSSLFVRTTKIGHISSTTVRIVFDSWVDRFATPINPWTRSFEHFGRLVRSPAPHQSLSHFGVFALSYTIHLSLLSFVFRTCLGSLGQLLHQFSGQTTHWFCLEITFGVSLLF
jgi:hypothetical protein